MREEMPVVFVGHGSPENAFEVNEYNKGWKLLAEALPRPKAVLCVSAHWVTSTHWVTSGTAVTAMERPRTIHDFYGFPEPYYRLEYPAPGLPELAARVKAAVTGVRVEYDYEWGLDHGTWSVLANMYPAADIPALQLSIDGDLPIEQHLRIGRELAILRREGVLILGSGNIVHNLMLLDPDASPFPWALEFDAAIREALLKKDTAALTGYDRLPSAELALPTNEHFLPLLYAAGAAADSRVRFFNEGIFAGSVSMRCCVFG